MNRRLCNVALKSAIALLFFSCASAPIASPKPFAVLYTPTASEKALTQCSRPAPKFGGYWTPTQPVVDQLERDLHRLHRQKARLCCLLGARLQRPTDYYRQYVGVTVDGRRLIYINAFSHPPTPTDQWRQDAVVYCDGGDSAWGAIYDPATRRFKDLAFNGSS